MTRILIHETSLQRVQPRLPVLSPGDEWLILGKDGVFRLNGAEVGPDAGNPDIAWLSLEAFGARGFWDMALASDRLVWLQSCAAGFDHPNFQRLMDKGARLTTNHSQAVGMAEYVLWGVLNHFQNGPERAAEHRQHGEVNAHQRQHHQNRHHHQHCLRQPCEHHPQTGMQRLGAQQPRLDGAGRPQRRQ